MKIVVHTHYVGRDKAPFKEEEHPRRSDGEFSSTSGAASPGLKKLKQRVFTGEPVETISKLTKLETGALGERIALDYLKSIGLKNAAPINSKVPNFPIDLMAGNFLVEVKTGMISNGKSAQKWRATIGQPGKAETEWLKTASPEAKAAWNQEKMTQILQRKTKALRDHEAATGKKVKAKTLTMIINPDTKQADVFMFDGFHHHIRWGSAETKAAHVGSFAYG